MWPWQSTTGMGDLMREVLLVAVADCRLLLPISSRRRFAPSPAQPKLRLVCIRAGDCQIEPVPARASRQRTRAAGELHTLWNRNKAEGKLGEAAIDSGNYGI